MGIENPVHILFIAIVALIVLGPKRLPDLARALGSGIREFRDAVSEGSEHRPQAPVTQAPPVTQAAPVTHTASAVQHPDLVDPPQAVPSGDAPDRGQL